jgi:hypothetical protein
LINRSSGDTSPPISWMTSSCSPPTPSGCQRSPTANSPTAPTSPATGATPLHVSACGNKRQRKAHDCVTSLRSWFTRNPSQARSSRCRGDDLLSAVPALAHLCHSLDSTDASEKGLVKIDIAGGKPNARAHVVDKGRVIHDYRDYDVGIFLLR